MNLFVKGLIVGFCLAAPVGPIAAICVQRTISKRLASGVLSGMGNRSLVRNPVSQQHSYRMNTGDKDGAMPAFAASRLIARTDLAQPGKEIERAILYWEREARGNH